MLVMMQNPCLIYPSKWALVNGILPRVVERTKEKFIVSTFKSCHSCIVLFDIWISLHFFNNKWEPYHIIVGFSETINIFGNAMALKVNDVFAKYGLNVWVITYVKDEGVNLNTMTNALTYVVSCEALGLQTPFVGSCWGRAMSKCIQYAIDYAKVSIGLTFVSIKEV